MLTSCRHNGLYISLLCDVGSNSSVKEWRSWWSTFHAPGILPYILTSICWRNVIPRILVSYDPIIDLKIYLGQCDVYFMVQWFCLISWILFDGETSFLDYTPSDLMIDLKKHLGQCDLYFIVQCLFLIAWILFDGETSYLDYKFHLTQWLT